MFRNRRGAGDCTPFTVSVVAMRTIAAFILLTSLAANPSPAATYQSADEFLKQTFGGAAPPPEVVWMTGATRSDATAILGHEPQQLRVRYWRSGQRTAWILDEIGKEQPITTGIVVDAGKVERIRVLIFRESRGWEVRHEFFTDQFKQRALTADLQLDRPIDGISGATLSVRAVTNLARLALYLHQQVVERPDVAP